jgi:hypothetical protein
MQAIAGFLMSGGVRPYPAVCGYRDQCPAKNPRVRDDVTFARALFSRIRQTMPEDVAPPQTLVALTATAGMPICR